MGLAIYFIVIEVYGHTNVVMVGGRFFILCGNDCKLHIVVSNMQNFFIGIRVYESNCSAHFLFVCTGNIFKAPTNY